MDNRLGITRAKWIETIFQNRWPQFLLRAITLAGFVFTIIAGLFGSVVGSHNFAIIFVWIAWWTALKLFFIPFGGRSWCSICPIPMPGEWLQNDGMLRFRPQKARGLNLSWPKSLRGNWLQAFGFMMVGLFSALTLTSAKVTALVLLAIILLALILSLIFERRSFCNYLCPIGGFTGLYAQVGPVEVRVKDKEVCLAHSEKSCYEVCPWGQYPLALKSSANCGLCMECLRVCPSDNLAVNLRPWGNDLGINSKHNLGETFLGLVMLSSVLLESAIFLGPWGKLKMAAYTIGSHEWFVFAGLFLLASLVLLPGFYGLTSFTARKLDGNNRTFLQTLAHYSQVLVPLGMMAWIAFTISFAFVKFGYVMPVVSDPMGWGWNLLGLKTQPGVGQSTYLIQVLQVAVLSLGYLWAARIAIKISSSIRQAIPYVFFSGVFTVGLLWILVG